MEPTVFEGGRFRALHLRPKPPEGWPWRSPVCGACNVGVEMSSLGLVAASGFSLRVVALGLLWQRETPGALTWLSSLGWVTQVQRGLQLEGMLNQLAAGT